MATSPRDLGERIGEGTYGTVFKRQWDGGAVAVKLCKSLRATSEGVPLSAYRELLALRRLATSASPFVVELRGASLENGSMSFTLGYVETTLMVTVVRTPHILTRSAVQHVMLRCARALEFMHSRWFVHRDISLDNILVSSDLSTVRVADLGMSRPFLSPIAPLGRDGDVVKLNYRAPELLLGCQTYGPPIDLWALGCILVEMLLRRLIAFGGTPLSGEHGVELGKLTAIVRVLGPPEAEWPGVRMLPHWASVCEDVFIVAAVAPQRRAGLSQHLADAQVRDEAALDIALGLLRYPPSARLTAAGVLNSTFCRERMSAVPPSDILASRSGAQEGASEPPASRSGAQENASESCESSTLAKAKKRRPCDEEEDTEDSALLRRSLAHVIDRGAADVG
jgi:serine/threonine protein kinase